MRSLLLLALLLTGCQRVAGPTPQPDSYTKNSPSYQPVAIAPTDPIRITVCKLPELEAAIAAHKGKVVVVDLWATFCRPCIEKYPKMLELQEKYAARGVVMISVSLDQKEDVAKAQRVLEKLGSKVQNFLLDEPAELVEAKLGSTAIPVVRVYDRDGKLKRLFVPEDVFEVKDVEKVVQDIVG